MAELYVADLMKTYHGNIDEVLANYNSSPRGTRRFVASGGRDFGSLPLETQKYIARAHILMASNAGKATTMNHHVAKNTSIKTEVGKVYIQTAATDASGIAASITPALTRHLDASMSNSGQM